jgi:hypothetical protein
MQDLQFEYRIETIETYNVHQIAFRHEHQGRGKYGREMLC